MGVVSRILQNPIDRNTTIGQARQEVLNALPLIPEPIGNTLLLNLGVAEWGARNPGPMEQPEFLNAFLNVFGPNVSQIGRTPGAGNPPSMFNLDPLNLGSSQPGLIGPIGTSGMFNLAPIVVPTSTILGIPNTVDANSLTSMSLIPSLIGGNRPIFAQPILPNPVAQLLAAAPFAQPAFTNALNPPQPNLFSMQDIIFA